MKNIFRLMLLIVLGVSINSHSQSSNTNMLLTGTWVFDYDTSVDQLTSDKKSMLKTFSAEVVTGIEQAYKNRRLIFDSSGSYIQVSQDGRKTTGTWNFDADKLVLQMTNSTGELLELRVPRLTDKNLLLIPIEQGESTILINQWYYTKL